MKKYFIIALVAIALSSCGASETTDKEIVEAPDTFGMEMPIEALESTAPYQGTGNMSDGADQR
ncbi:MAG: hypothetical protein IKV83_04470 [Muribaculaceae bacterium]|nr:hypothetical protein [Muribaculaceae bacterium]